MDEVINFNSQLGSIEISGSEDGISSIAFLQEEVPETEEIKIKEVSDCKTQLQEYFNGTRNWFSVKLNPTGTDFQKKVWSLVQQIDYGETSSYSQIAKALGDINFIRAVGMANSKNPIPIIIPCHRVIGKNGELVGYAGGLERKEWLLVHEGAIKNNQLNIFDT